MKKYFLIAIIVFVCFGQVSADNKSGKTLIEINLPSHTLSLYTDGILIKEYPVCLGSPKTPTPQGEYRIVYKTVDPYWIDKEVIVPPGPKNPLGRRWLGITKGIGIHGNNKAKSIGGYESAGCIRMYNRDVEELYSVVPVNTPVIIKYERVKVFEDIYLGEKAVIVYPDSYKADKTKNDKLSEKLLQMGISEALIEKTAEVLKTTGKRPRIVSKGIGIFMNDSLVTCDALVEQDEIYMNYKAAEDILGLTAGMAEQFDIEIKELGKNIYVNLTQTVKRFGGNMSYDAEGRNVYINMKLIKVNGVFAGLNHGDYDRLDFLKAEALKQLEYEFSEDAVDIRLFDKGMLKLKRDKILGVNIDNVIGALGGNRSVNSCYGIVDLKLPTFIRFDNEYFKTDTIEGRLVLSSKTAQYIRGKTSRAEEAFFSEEEVLAENIDLELFLENYDYHSNNLKTVIDIKIKDSQSLN